MFAFKVVSDVIMLPHDVVEVDVMFLVVDVVLEEEDVLLVVLDGLEDERFVIEEVEAVGLVEDLLTPPTSTAALMAAAIRMTTTITIVTICPIPALLSPGTM
jgi:hypothetical protein